MSKFTSIYVTWFAKKPVDTKAHLLALLILVALKHHVKVLKTVDMTVARKSKGENSTLLSIV